jgi:hypothetical protein
VLVYARVGPNSEDIVRVRPFPSWSEFCLAGGDADREPLESLDVPCAITEESILLWVRRESSTAVESRPFEGLKSRDVGTERLSLFMVLKGIGESVRRGAFIKVRVSSVPAVGLLFSLSR